MAYPASSHVIEGRIQYPGAKRLTSVLNICFDPSPSCLIDLEHLEHQEIFRSGLGNTMLPHVTLPSPGSRAVLPL